MESKEEWEVIDNHPSYSISDLGNVRGPRGLVAPQVCGNNVQRVKLYDADGNRIWRNVHALVIEAFDGEVLPNSSIIHRNGMKSDNRLDNLMVMSKGMLQVAQALQTIELHRPDLLGGIQDDGEIQMLLNLVI